VLGTFAALLLLDLSSAWHLPQRQTFVIEPENDPYIIEDWAV
jgi:hypothetical protein